MGIYEYPHVNLNVFLWFTWGDSQSPHVNERRCCVYMGRFVISPCKSNAIDICMCMYICLHVYRYVCMHIYIYMYVYTIYTYIYVYTYIHINIHIYVIILRFTWGDYESPHVNTPFSLIYMGRLRISPCKHTIFSHLHGDIVNPPM